jgi:hypothetical protein
LAVITTAAVTAALITRTVFLIINIVIFFSFGRRFLNFSFTMFLTLDQLKKHKKEG